LKCRFNGQNPTVGSSILSAAAEDLWSLDLCEGDAFGAEFLVGGIPLTSRHLATAVAVSDSDSGDPVKLAFLLVDNYVRLLSPMNWFPRKSRQGLPQNRNHSQIRVFKR
jgi:hypothetical protein